MRIVFAVLAHLLVWSTVAQDMDSIHVYKRVPEGTYSSAQANALAWRLHREKAPHRTVKGPDMEVVGEAMDGYRPERHTYGTIPDLTHVAMAFNDGRPIAFGVANNLGLVVNFTARTEYRIANWSEHLTVRALLSRLLVE